MDLRKIRIRAGLTVTQVAQEAGITRQTVERMERGKEPVSVVNAQRVANVLGRYLGRDLSYQDLEILVSE